MVLVPHIMHQIDEDFIEKYKLIGKLLPPGAIPRWSLLLLAAYPIGQAIVADRHPIRPFQSFPRYQVAKRDVRLTHAPQSDLDCIRRILNGEAELFHDLFRPCERSVYLMLFALLKNEADAEDAAQETAIKAYRNLNLFRGDAQFRTWVLSIARNEGLARLRKLGQMREDSLDAETDEQTGDYTPAVLTSWQEIPAEALERKELGAILRKAVESLPAIYRNVVLLRDIEELDIRETASALGISEAAVKVRLHRARALLQRQLAPQLKEFAPRKRWFWGRA